MIDIGKGRGTISGYGYTLMGNDGEEELSIMLSPSQAGKSPVVIVSNSIDGGPIKVLINRRWVQHDEIPELLNRVIYDWGCSGIKPSDDERKSIVKAAKRAADAAVKHFHLR